MRAARRLRRGGPSWLGRSGVQRGARVGAVLCAFLLLVSGLSTSALTAGIQISATAIGPPEHTFGDDGAPGASGRRTPIPRAAFERVRGLPARGPAAFGGDRVYDIDVDGTSYRVHEFTTVGSATLTVARALDVEVLIVGGGGGGGGSIAGGGGAGEFVVQVGAGNRVSLTPSGSPFTVAVGAGGAGGSYTGPTNGGDGADSSAFGITAAGGGGGGAIFNAGRPGGSGGGGGSVTSNVGGAADRSGTVGGVLVGFANAGGIGSCGTCGSANAVAGGGGGAGGVGSASSGQQGGDGGPGRSSSITGVSREFAGGGGGGINSDQGARSSGPSGAGLAGGGAGGDWGARASVDLEHFGLDAVAGSGSGGGGAGNKPGHSGRLGGNGGSGIVIVRYEIPRSTWAPVASGGTVTEFVGDGTNGTVDGFRYRVHTFAADDTFVVADGSTLDEVDVLLVGGGGGGGSRHGGGGGGGGVVESSGRAVTVGSHAVTFGRGGVGMTASTPGADGEDSGFLSLVADGGGRGAGHLHGAGTGGSGGGSTSASSGANGVAEQGNSGGLGVSGSGGDNEGGWAGGGGGGAGGAGSSGTGGGSARDASAGQGGDGRTSTMSGAALVYGGGGGGAISHRSSGIAGAAGSGGGGAGGSLGWELYNASGVGRALSWRFFLHNRNHPVNATDFDAFFTGAPHSSGSAPLATVDQSASGTTLGTVNALNWTSAADLSSVIGALPRTDNFAFEVTGWFVPRETGTYYFTSESDDATDLRIGDTTVASFYGGRGTPGLGTTIGSIGLVAGQAYALRARMEEVSGGEGLRVFWQTPTQRGASTSTWWQNADELVGASPSGSPTSGPEVTRFIAASSRFATPRGLATVGSQTAGGAATPNTLNWLKSADNSTNELSQADVIGVAGLSLDFMLTVAGTFVPTETGTYTFALSGDDAVDLTVDGTTIVSDYGQHAAPVLGTRTGTAALTAGVPVRVAVRHHQRDGGAELRVFWRKPSQSTGWHQDSLELRAGGRDGIDGLGGGGGAGGSADAANASGGRGGDGVVIVRYPLYREVGAIPSEVREAIAGEGETTAVLRWRVPATDAPSVDLDGYRIEYATTDGNSWTSLTSGVTFSTSGTGSDMLATAALTGIPDTSRHRFRITPLAAVEGSSTIVTPVAKGGDIVALVGDDVAHQYTTVGAGGFDLAAARTVEYLVVGGGGGGGTGWDGAPGGGGGAGGVLQGADDLTTDASVTISVGGGGAGGSGGGGFDNPNVVGMATKGRDGTASSFGGLAAPGGGGGGEARAPGNAGGSGGGAGGRHNVASSRIGGGRVLAGTGNPGGGSRSTSGTGAGGGGGGGAGGAGASTDGTTAGGAGGSGIASSISGATVAYAVGGVGGAFGIASDVPGVDATVRGSGGGGGAKNGSGGVAGGSGATGTVILRYAYSTPPARGGDAVYDILDDGVAYRVHEFRTPGAHTLEALRDIDIEYLVVAGGASGTRGHCGVLWGHGGGGGGVSTGSAPVAAGSIPVTVGPGGAGSTTATCGVQHSGNDGGASTLGLGASTVTSTGGKGAVSNQVTGGASGTGTIDGVASIAQGGGGSGGQPLGAGGGGGAGGAANGVNGGPGVDIAITGVPTTYGAGGPGRSNVGFGTPSPRVLGVGGGGYDYFGSRDWTFAPGGDGAVIVRYRIPSDGLDPLVATGGSVTTFVGDGTTGDDGDVYRVHTFLANDTFTVTHGSGDVEYLVVGGGGGSGNTMGGGGGAGGVLTGTVAASTRTVVIGPGGAGSNARGSRGVNGTASQFGAVTGAGGGGGGSWSSPSGATGGSGGGGSAGGGTGAAASGSGQGSAGGAFGGVTGGYHRAGGGGGAGGAGASGASQSAGGAGLELSFSGVPEIYAAGGGGGTNGGTAGAGGSNGVGGRGGTACTFNGTAPVANSGSGGGGGGYSGGCDGAGGSGAAGIVIVRYPVGRPAQFPSAVRDAVAGEGATTAVIRFTVPAEDAPGPADAAPTSAHYRIERQAIGSSVWYPVGPSQTFSVTGSGASRVVTVEHGDVPSDSRHAFRIIPIGIVDGPSTIVEPVAKGGDTVTLVGDDVVHQYMTVGSAAFDLAQQRTVRHLLVGGGGAGGSVSRGSSGGAGGGRVIDATNVVTAPTAIAVTVGGGGAPTAAGSIGTVPSGGNGASSSIVLGGTTVGALGGGGGANSRPFNLTQGTGSTSGWTGGGGSVHAGTRSLGSTGVGGAAARGGAAHADGSVADPQSAGGGGGAGGVGANAAPGSAGAGGIGALSDITGTSLRYGGGGGGGKRTNSGSAGAGGAGGGGAGGKAGVGGSSGASGTGGGGGGAGEGANQSGGAGGSGIVVVRYPFLDSGVQGGVFAATATSAVLRWEDPAVGAETITGYRIERLGPPSAEWGGATVATPTPNSMVQTLELSGLTSNAQRRFRVTALHGDRDGSTTELTVNGRGGDTVTLVGDEVVHQYTTVGTRDFELAADRTVEYLIVGGGGGGGRGFPSDHGGGGGGGGQVVTGTPLLGAGTRSVTVGQGGQDRTTSADGRGAASSVSTVASAAGGGGGAWWNNPATTGATGGGGAARHTTTSASWRFGAPGTAGQGFAGGSGDSGVDAGGGGGAGGVGIGHSSGSGGGAGLDSSITGTTWTYGAGGGGGRGSNASGVGASLDGPGAGGSIAGNGGAGAAGSGGGGGGGSGAGGSNWRPGGDGGSGIVILRYSLTP